LGVKVLLLDSHNPPHDKGSHHGETRIIRHAYGEGSNYVPLVLRAQQLWDQLEQEAGMKLFLQTGVLCAGGPESSFVKQTAESGRTYSLPVELLTKDEIEYRWHGFSLPEGYIGCYEPYSGVLFSEQCIAAFRKLGLENGMTFLPFTRVNKIEMDANGAVIQTDNATYFTDFTIVSAGAWSGKILKDTGIDLPLSPVRKTVSWFQCEQDLYDAKVFPAYTFDLQNAHYYGFPSINGSGVKVGRHDGGQPIDPDEKISPFAPIDEADIRSFLNKFLPHAKGPLIKGSTCIYTLTPDEDFILDRHPEFRHLFIAAGFSGHGFKFSSVVGEMISHIITKGKTPFDLASFAINR